MKLRDLARGLTARVVAIEAGSEELNARLRELGLSEGDEVEMWAKGPFGGNPIAVRLNRTIIALRRDEAEAITVSLQEAATQE
jgi:ferrous iron transport protein A